MVLWLRSHKRLAFSNNDQVEQSLIKMSLINVIFPNENDEYINLHNVEVITCSEQFGFQNSQRKLRNI